MKNHSVLQLLFQRFSDDEWLTVFSRKDVVRTKNVISIFLLCMMVTFLASFALLAFASTALLELTTFAFIVLSFFLSAIVYSNGLEYAYLSPSQLDELDASDLLKGLAKEQGFLLKGQADAARRKAAHNRESRIKREWGIK